MTDLDRLEAEAVHILREAHALFERPVLMFSVGKDSCVLAHLARKAFAPGKLPFPLLHIDTGWKFAEMISFRDAEAQRQGWDMRVHTHTSAQSQGVTPFSHGSKAYTAVMKTEALRQALDAGRFDAIIGGARRDEEASRAKERVFSMRNKHHGWDPKRQRPELWRLVNAQLGVGESVRVFPLSNWTELDVWHYVRREKIPVVSLYFSRARPVVWRDGQWLMRDDERMALLPREEVQLRQVRFRTLGCYPLSGAMESSAHTLDGIIDELASSRFSERQGRLIDRDEDGAMEVKKRDGYF